jgi:hypothetical protein
VLKHSVPRFHRLPKAAELFTVNVLSVAEELDNNPTPAPMDILDPKGAFGPPRGIDHILRTGRLSQIYEAIVGAITVDVI